MIEVDHISKSFGPVQAVRDISFTVRAGEILGFLGPNGAGKTTTMRILTGFYPPSLGSARVCGLDVRDNSLAVRRKIGYLPENVPLYGDMTVAGCLKFVAEVKGVPRSRRKSEIGRAVEDCGLAPVEHRFIKKLSKGYRQRVGLAQALIGDPEVLILDEPTIGLDPRQIGEIRELVKSFAGRKTVILSSHILPEVALTCQRVVIVNRGRVAAEDSPENLSGHLAGRDRIRLRIGGPEPEILDRLSRLPGVGQVESSGDGLYTLDAGEHFRPRIAQEICSAGWDLFELTPVRATLEDVFLNLVTRENEETSTLSKGESGS